MMAETRARTGPAAPARRGPSSTRSSTPTHTGVHTVHTSVPGVPGGAAPRVDEAADGVHTDPAPAGSIHTAADGVHTLIHTGPARMWTVSVLVWAARWVAPAAGGLFLVGGAYAGPLSVVPVPVLLALAAVGFTLQAAPAGGGR